LKRPEKKEYYTDCSLSPMDADEWKAIGYNQAIDDMDKWIDFQNVSEPEEEKGEAK